MENLNAELAKRTNIATEASWAYASNITDENERNKNAVAAEVAKFVKEASQELQKLAWRSYKSEDLKRQIESLSKLGYAALSELDYADLLDTLSSMESNFAKVRICDIKDKTKCDLSLDPDLEEIIAKSRDPEELKYYWREFYDKAGTPTRPAFEKYIELNTKAAKLNGESTDLLQKVFSQRF